MEIKNLGKGLTIVCLVVALLSLILGGCAKSVPAPLPPAATKPLTPPTPLTTEPSTPPTPTLTPTPTATATPKLTPTSTSRPTAPLGEIGGLHYVYWDFGMSNFRSILVDITIYSEPDNKDGLYFQMYQGQINGVGFYFGLQTDVYKPDTGSTGKGLLASRWGTKDLSNVRTVAGGWSQAAGYEGDFVGIRRNYEWTTHSYQLEISYTESDGEGDWYGIWILDLNNDAKDSLGSIRFPKTASDKSGIQNGGITWTELYYKKVSETPLPTWHVSVDSIQAVGASGGRYLPRSATSDYSKIGNTDIYYEAATKKIHFVMGPEVRRTHAAGRLF